MRFTAALFALAITLTGINADLVAFSELNCEGTAADEGVNVACDGSTCYPFVSRNSVESLAGTILVQVFANSGCNDEVTQIEVGQNEPGQTSNAGPACSNVNAVANVQIQSFLCSIDNNTVSTTTVVQTVIGMTSTSIASGAGSTSTTSTTTSTSSASPKKKIFHWTGALLWLAAGNLLIF